MTAVAEPAPAARTAAGDLRRLVERRPVATLAVVAAGLALVRLLAFDLTRYLSFDEAIYLSEVYPATSPIGFGAHRARGLPWLVAPVALFSPPLWVIRLFLIGLWSGCFLLAFRVWLPVLGIVRTATAALAFGTSWMALHYGSELYPNGYVAIGAIFAAGSFAQHLTGPAAGAGWRSRPLWAAAAGIAVVAVIRPTEAAVVAAGLAVTGVLATREVRRLAAAWGVLAAGLLAGWLPWLIEAVIRYGGPRARLAEASGNVGGGLLHLENLRSHLALVDGPITGGPGAPVPLIGYALWALLAAGVAGALWRSVFRSDHRAAVAAVTGLAVLSQYLLTEVVQARFLLPAYGLLIVATVAAVPPAGERHRVRRGYLVAGALALAVWAPHQLQVADQLEAEQVARRHNSLQLARVLQARSGSGPCWFTSQFGFPEIAFSSGCQGVILRPDQSQVRLPEPPGTQPVYGLSVTHPDELAVPALPGTVRSLEDEGAPRWWIFEVAPEGLLPR